MTSVIQTYCESYAFNRSRTMAALDRAVSLGDDVLGWRPGPGRAHTAWQLMHIAVTEELFATERLRSDATPNHAELIERFRGGSTVDDNIPSAESLRSVLESTRESLLSTLNGFSDSQLDEIVFAQREWTLRTVLQVISWHESHHQGQAHITLNLWESQN